MEGSCCDGNNLLAKNMLKEPCQETLRNVLDLLRAKGLHEAYVVIRDSFTEASVDRAKKHTEHGEVEDNSNSIKKLQSPLSGETVLSTEGSFSKVIARQVPDSSISWYEGQNASFDQRKERKGSSVQREDSPSSDTIVCGSVLNSKATSEYVGYRKTYISDLRRFREQLLREEVSQAEKIDQVQADEATNKGQQCPKELEVLFLKVLTISDRTGPATSDAISIGMLIAERYRVEEIMGEAAFSIAVAAHDTFTGVDVCLKICKNSKSVFDQGIDEIRLLAAINKVDPDGSKSYILRLLDFFYFQERLILVLELLKANLFDVWKYNNQLLSAGPWFTMRRLQRIAYQVLQSLKFLHDEMKMIHCDLKPENIVVESYSRSNVKVVDLGSSAFQTDKMSSYVQSRAYRAPEVVLGQPFDFKIDIWSLGCVLAELFSGSVLFQNDSVPTMIGRIVAILGEQTRWIMFQAGGKYRHHIFTRNGDIFERDSETGEPSIIRPISSSLKEQLRNSPDIFVHFIQSLLFVNPNERPSASEALQHPFFEVDFPMSHQDDYSGPVLALGNDESL